MPGLSEADLAGWLNATTAAGRPITPGGAFGAALASCLGGSANNNGTAAFCAAITLHNTLRALGRSATYVDKHGVDYLPAWYKQDRDGWRSAAARMKVTAMIDLQVNGGGGCRNSTQATDDCWGEWYVPS